MLPPTLRWIAGSAVTTTSASSETMKNEIEVSASTSGSDTDRWDTARPREASFIGYRLRCRPAAPGRAPGESGRLTFPTEGGASDRQLVSGIFVAADQLVSQGRH